MFDRLAVDQTDRSRSGCAVIDANEPAEIERILDGLVDPTGQFYRFNLAGSLLRAGTPTCFGAIMNI